jgi:hypothetical protein
MTAHLIVPDAVKRHRAETYRMTPGRHLTSVEDAIQFVNERSFVLFWPNKGIEFPSLWTAVAGNRPVADEHDDPGHVTWGWKDSQLGGKNWYYGRVLRGKNSMLSLEVLPYFYALSANYGDPEADYLIEYEQGTLSQEARLVFEALLKNGALDTLALRKAAHLQSSTSSGPFNRALEDLQMGFKVIPTGISEAGAWHYSFIYDLTYRHFPTLIEQAGAIKEAQARLKLATCYLRSQGAAETKELGRMFRWRPDALQRTVQTLIESGFIVKAENEQAKGEWLALPELTARE